MSDVTLSSGQVLRNVHGESECSPPCPIHSPSDHHMRDWSQVWEYGRMRRVCEHGVAHPDPDEKRDHRDTFLLREAVASVSLSHLMACECDICLAGKGDEDAFARVLEVQLHGGVCDGCCA